jgi:hypothetical protein
MQSLFFTRQDAPNPFLKSHFMIDDSTLFARQSILDRPADPIFDGTKASFVNLHVLPQSLAHPIKASAQFPVCQHETSLACLLQSDLMGRYRTTKPWRMA